MSQTPIGPLLGPIDRTQDTPLFRQVIDSIQGAIQDGQLAGGDRLGSELQLAESLGVSRPTIRQALRHLEDRGLIERRRGVGTMISDAPHTQGSASNSDGRPIDSKLLGVTVPDLQNPFFSGLVQAVERAARLRDLMLVVSGTDEDLVLERRAIETMASEMSRLLLIAPRNDDAEIESLFQSRSRVVTVNRRLANHPCVQADVASGMVQALDHLAALGHHSIGYVAGPPTSRAGRKIQQALERAAKTRGCDVKLITHVPATHAGGFSAGDVVLAAEVTAVVCHNDLIALGVMARLAERGCSVPEDISVVGCDDIPMASMSTPTLTSVAIHVQDMGRLAVQYLTGEGSPPPEENSTAQVPSHLVVRGSTAPAR